MRSVTTVLLLMGLTSGALSGDLARVPDRRHAEATCDLAIAMAPNVENGSSHKQAESLDEIVISQDFESTVSGALPAGWSRLDQDRGFSSFFNRRSSWLVYEYGSQNAHSGTRVLMCHFNDPPDANNDYLILPQQQLSGAISLSYWVASQDPEYLESYEVRVSTMHPIPAHFVSLIHAATNVPAQWTQQTLDLSAFAGSPFWIAFRHTSYDRFLLKLDDLTLEGTPVLTGAIRGVVINDTRRSSGTVGAVVLLRGQFLRTAVAGSGGRYVVSGLPAGNYDLEYYNYQFAPASAGGITVTVPDTSVRDVYVTSARGNTLLVVTQAATQAIRDFDTTRMNLDVDTALVIQDLSVAVNLNHTYIGDLRIWLRSSYGQVVQLLERDPLVSGDNLVNCHFADHAPLAYGAGYPPFTGLWRPEENLSLFRGAKTIGRWTLLVYDGGGGDQGHLLNYSLYATVSREPVDSPPLPAITLDSNYPNPFNSITRLKFTLAQSGRVRLTVYNLQGQLVSNITYAEYPAGVHEVLFDASGLPSGVYIAAASNGEAKSTRKIVLLK